jgi:hypothetical protein
MGKKELAIAASKKLGGSVLSSLIGGPLGWGLTGLSIASMLPQFFETPREGKQAEREREFSKNQLTAALMAIMEDRRKESNRNRLTEQAISAESRARDLDRFAGNKQQELAGLAALKGSSAQQQMAQAMAISQQMQNRFSGGLNADLSMLSGMVGQDPYERLGWV